MRETVLSEWLLTTEWAAWTRTSIVGDASARRYERLVGPNGNSVILMDAPPDICGSQKPFVGMAKHLTDTGLSAPEIFDWSDELGLMVISDLGSVDFSKHLKLYPRDERVLYETAVDTLRKLNSVSPPIGLSKMTPDVGTEMIGLAFDWAAIDKSADLRAEIESAMHSLLAQTDPTPTALSLRDFHAENLIWRSDQNGVGRVGLLDFQDAFVTHSTYDLASLLRDARRDIDSDMLDDLLLRLDPEADQTTQLLAFHIMAVQRNLRILGIFHRLAERDGKVRYLDFLPRVENHLRLDLNAPELNPLKDIMTRAFLGTNK